MFYGRVKILEVSSKDIPCSSEVPPGTTGDEIRVGDVEVESEEETNEEQLGVREDYLADFEGAMYEKAM